MNENNLIKYYNKFNESKRLKTRHGKIEYIITMKYIHDLLFKMKNAKIIDIGAGMGAYSIPLFKEGYDITSVDLIKHNLAEIKKINGIKCFQLSATNLKNIKENTYDLVLLLGPMYHLINKEDKLKALNEAKRVVKKNGFILVAYLLNDYAIITRAFKEKKILDEIKKGRITKDFHVVAKEDDLYDYVNLKDIDELNKLSKLNRIKIFSPDGPVNYTRKYNNLLNDEEFDYLINYVISISERQDLIGASAHVVDILQK